MKTAGIWMVVAVLVIAAVTVEAEQVKTETVTLGGGCFWCIEAVFQQVEGVVSVKSGYMGGQVKNPSYKQVCTGNTGHAEVIQVEFDPAEVTLEQLLDLFWRAHDPTQLNRQGNDVGPQYRSVIFYRGEEQRVKAEASKAALGESGRYDKPVVTQIVPASEFYEAEGYHQDYYANNKSAPYCRFVILPKLRKLGMDH